MPELKLGIQLRGLRLPFRKALLTAAELGVRGVEIDARGEVRPEELSGTGLRQLRKMLEDMNLEVVALTYRTRRGYDIEDDLDRRVAGTKEALKAARSLGAVVVVNQVGRVPTDRESKSWRLMLDVLGDIGAFGQHVGAMLAAETGSESGPDLARLVEALPAGALGVTLDPGNLAVNGHSTQEAIQALGREIVYVHAKDGVRDLAQGRGVEVPLGRGSVDFPALLAALEEREYRGWFTIERENAQDPPAEFSQAVRYLKSL